MFLERLKVRPPQPNEAVIVVRFIATTGFVGAAIRRLTGSLFQHVEFRTPEGTWIGAHDKGGVQERDANYCTCTREYIYGIPCADSQLASLMAWARTQVGTKYNFKDIAGLLLEARAMTTPHRLICSQFVLDGLLRVFGPQKVLNVLPDWTYRITPETLHLSPIFAGHMISRKG